MLDVCLFANHFDGNMVLFANGVQKNNCVCKKKVVGYIAAQFHKLCLCTKQACRGVKNGYY